MTEKDPFEAAAQSEWQESIKRRSRDFAYQVIDFTTTDPELKGYVDKKLEKKRAARMQHRPHSGGLAFWFPPYLVWALIRATNHDWDSPTVGKSVYRFFLGSGFWFSAATVLVLLWTWGYILRRSRWKHRR